MRKYLRYANFIALCAGTVGMALSAWLFAVGTDEKGLYPANHPAWILLGILTAAVVILFWLLSRQAGINRNYRQNFPPSILAACGLAAGAIGLLLGGFSSFGTGKGLGMITGALGVLGSLPLFWAAVCRFQGQRCNLPVHIVPCFFFALQLFVLGQKYGSEPEMCRYLYRFWAYASMVPACYWLWSFDVKLGKRPDCIFWCLVAGYCNLVAAVSGGHTLLHLGAAIWMLTALPKLDYLPRPPKASGETVPAEDSPAPAPQEPQLPLPDPQLPEEQPITPTLDILSPHLPDTNAILEELLRDLEEQEKP